jgi:hypothetical protein
VSAEKMLRFKDLQKNAESHPSKRQQKKHKAIKCLAPKMPNKDPLMTAQPSAL